MHLFVVVFVVNILVVDDAYNFSSCIIRMSDNLNTLIFFNRGSELCIY